MSTLPTEPESPPRTVSSRAPPPVYAEVFSVSENNYAPAQFTFQSIDRFLLALLCICVTCFLFLNLTFALYLYFQYLLSDGRHYCHFSPLSLVASSPPVPGVRP